MRLKFLFIGLFFIVAAANVIFCAADRQKPRHFTKVLLMPLLLAVYAISCREFSPLVAAGLLFGWGGDIAMIYKADRRALAGGISLFGVGHIFYISAIVRGMGLQSLTTWGINGAPSAVTVLVTVCVAAAVGIASYLYLRRDIPARLRALSLVYSLLLCALCAAALLSLTTEGRGGLKLLAGAVCFLISDSTLSLETFRLGDTPKTDAAVMLTYLAAQALITAGFCV